MRDPWRRRSILAILFLVLAVLSIWPQAYVAKAELAPEDTGGSLASLLSGSGGPLASLGALVAGRQSIEADLTIARSIAVSRDAAVVLKQRGLLRGAGRTTDSFEHAASTLRHTVHVEAIRGSILQIFVTDHDPVFAKAAVDSYAIAIRGRLAAIDVGQTSQKKALAANRLANATLNLARAQAALDQFRILNKLALPQAELGAAISLVTGLQAQLQAQEAALVALETFATADNIQVQAARAQIAALRGQISQAQTNETLSPGPSVGVMTPKITEYENLYRNEKFAEAEYEIYKRYLDTVTVQLMSSDINMSVVEPPYVDPDRQFNSQPVAALVLLLLAGVLAEFYLARPPPGWSARNAR